MTASSQHVPHAFTAAQREFEDWRATRTSIRQRIPEPLWSLAMDLAIEHGTYRTAKALRLNSDTLKKRLEAVGTRPKALTKPKPAGIDSANFLALDASTVTAAAVAGVEGTIEFESPNGFGPSGKAADRGSRAKMATQLNRNYVEQTRTTSRRAAPEFRSPRPRRGIR